MNDNIEGLRHMETCGKHGAFVEPRECTRVGGRLLSCPECISEYRVELALIPERFRTKYLDTFSAQTEGERRALAVANEYVKNFTAHRTVGRCLVFSGNVGTGKTHLACAIALALAQRDQRVQYFTVTELIRRLRSCWDRGAPRKEADVLSDLCKLDLLVLDEVGVQFGRDSEIVQLTEVLDLRYREIKPTLLISNVPYRDLGQFVGERIVDRIRENGGKVLIFDWESRRGQLSTQTISGVVDATQRLQ